MPVREVVNESTGETAFYDTDSGRFVEREPTVVQRPSAPSPLERFRFPYQQSPAGLAVAKRYGVTPEQLGQTQEAAKQDIRQVPRETGRTMFTAGPAVAGAISGSALGPWGAVAGGGLGYGIGRKLSQYYGLERPPRDILEGLAESAVDIPTGAAQEMGGQAAGKVWSWLFGPRAGKVTPQGQRLSETLEKAGVTADPGDVAPGRMFRRVEAIAEKQVGGGRISEAGQREVAAMKGEPATGQEGWMGKEARRVSGPEHQLDASRVSRGETIQQGLKEIATTNRELSTIEWDMLKSHDTGIPDFGIDNLREVMREKMARAGTFQQAITPSTSSRLSSSGGSTAKGTWRPESTGIPRRKEPGVYSPEDLGPQPRPRRPDEPFVTERAVYGAPESQIVSGLARGQGPVTFEQARSVRAALGKLYDVDPKEWGGPLGAFNRDMELYASRNPARDIDWRRARQVTREQVVPFNRDQPLGQLIDKNEPMAVVQELMQPRDARISLLRAIHAQTGAKGPVWNAVNSEAVTRAIEKPAQLANMGPETKNLLFTPEQRLFLDEVQNWAQTSSASMKSEKGLFARTGTNIVGFDQLRHGVTLVLGGALGLGGAFYGQQGNYPMAAMTMGGAILVSPNVVARMVTNPATAKWLAQGFRTPAGSAEAIRVASQLLPAYQRAVREERQAEGMAGVNRILRGAP